MRRRRQFLTTDDWIQDRRLMRDVERLHGLGPRAVFEILSEVGRTRLCRTYIENVVARYAKIDPEAVRIVDGDRFPAPPIRGVA